MKTSEVLAFILVVVAFTVYVSVLARLITGGDKFPMQPNGIWGDSKMYECREVQK